MEVECDLVGLSERRCQIGPGDAIIEAMKSGLGI